MEFEGQYLTYEEYKALGGTLDLMPFNLLEFMARREIDKNTRQRMVSAENIPQQVKLCLFDLMDKIKKYESDRNKDISSETVGSYSVTYNDIKQVIEEKQEEINNIIVTDLYGVIYNGEHVIYSGV